MEDGVTSQQTMNVDRQIIQEWNPKPTCSFLQRHLPRFFRKNSGILFSMESAFFFSPRNCCLVEYKRIAWFYANNSLMFLAFDDGIGILLDVTITQAERDRFTSFVSQRIIETCVTNSDADIMSLSINSLQRMPTQQVSQRNASGWTDEDVLRVQTGIEERPTSASLAAVMSA